MRIFRKGPGPHALPLAVVGVKLGDRLLDVGADAGGLFAEMASKAGLTGRAFAAVGSEKEASRVRGAAAEAGVLVEVEAVAWPALPVAEAAFDVAVIDNTSGMVESLDGGTREGLAAEVFRALRPGGRALVLDRERGGLLAALTGGARRPWPASDAAALLASAGFKPVRLLAERDDQRFTEGWKPAPPAASPGS